MNNAQFRRTAHDILSQLIVDARSCAWCGAQLNAGGEHSRTCAAAELVREGPELAPTPAENPGPYVAHDTSVSGPGYVGSFRDGPYGPKYHAELLNYGYRQGQLDGPMRFYRRVRIHVGTSLVFDSGVPLAGSFEHCACDGGNHVRHDGPCCRIATDMRYGVKTPRLDCRVEEGIAGASAGSSEPTAVGGASAATSPAEEPIG